MVSNRKDLRRRVVSAKSKRPSKSTCVMCVLALVAVMLPGVFSSRPPDGLAGYGLGSSVLEPFFPHQIGEVFTATMLQDCSTASYGFHSTIARRPADFVLEPSSSPHITRNDQVHFYEALNSQSCTCIGGFNGRAKSVRQLTWKTWWDTSDILSTTKQLIWDWIINGVSSNGRPDHCHEPDNEFATNWEGRPDYGLAEIPRNGTCVGSETYYDCMQGRNLPESYANHFAGVKVTKLSDFDVTSSRHTLSPPVWALPFGPQIKIDDGHGHHCNFDGPYQNGFINVVSGLADDPLVPGWVTELESQRVETETCYWYGSGWKLPLTYTATDGVSTQHGCSEQPAAGSSGSYKRGARLDLVSSEVLVLSCRDVTPTTSQEGTFSLCYIAGYPSEVLRHTLSVDLEVSDYSSFTLPPDILPSAELTHCMSSHADPTSGCASTVCTYQATTVHVCEDQAGGLWTCPSAGGGLVDRLYPYNSPSCGELLTTDTEVLLRPKAATRRNAELLNSIAGSVHLISQTSLDLLRSIRQVGEFANQGIRDLIGFLGLSAPLKATRGYRTLLHNDAESRVASNVLLVERMEKELGDVAENEGFGDPELTYTGTTYTCPGAVNYTSIQGTTYCKVDSYYWRMCCIDFDDIGTAAFTGYAPCIRSKNYDRITGQSVSAQVSLAQREEALRRLQDIKNSLPDILQSIENNTAVAKEALDQNLDGLESELIFLTQYTGENAYLASLDFVKSLKQANAKRVKGPSVSGYLSDFWSLLPTMGLGFLWFAFWIGIIYLGYRLYQGRRIREPRAAEPSRPPRPARRDTGWPVVTKRPSDYEYEDITPDKLEAQEREDYLTVDENPSFVPKRPRRQATIRFKPNDVSLHRRCHFAIRRDVGGVLTVTCMMPRSISAMLPFPGITITYPPGDRTITVHGIFTAFLTEKVWEATDETILRYLTTEKYRTLSGANISGRATLASHLTAEEGEKFLDALGYDPVLYEQASNFTAGDDIT